MKNANTRKILPPRFPAVELDVTFPNEQESKFVEILYSTSSSLSDLQKTIEAGANGNMSIQGYSPLHIAVSSRVETKEKIKYLIQQGSDVNQLSKIKEVEIGTPLHLLLANETHELALYFIEQAKNKLDINLKDSEGKTPLLLAAKTRSAQLVKAILENFPKSIDVNAADTEGRTALHFACAYGNLSMVISLINAGAKWDVKDKSGKTPLDFSNYNELQILALLRSIEIEGNRDSAARLNAVCNSDCQPILINGKEVLANKQTIANTLFNNSPSMTGKLPTSTLSIILDELSTYSGKTLVDTCLAGQPLVREYAFRQNPELQATNRNLEEDKMVSDRRQTF